MASPAAVPISQVSEHPGLDQPDGRWAMGAWPGAVLLAALALAAYWPALGGRHVFDDHALLESGAVVSGSLADLWRGTGSDYWPLTFTSFWLEHRLLGGALLPGHLVNLGLHLVTALLLWRVLLRLAVPGAYAAALLFLVHPVTVESVAWLSERKNVLSGALFMGSGLLWLGYRAAGGWRRQAAALLLFLMALLAKTSTVMLPVVLLGLELLRPQQGRRHRVLALLPFFALALVLGSVTLWLQWTRALAGSGDARSLAERLLWPGWTVTTYLRHALLPVDLALLYRPWPVVPSSSWFAAPTFLLLALLAAAWRWRAGPGRGLLEALAYHATMLLPVSGVIQIAFFLWSPVANHLQYLALPGPLAWAASLLVGLRPGRWRRAGLVAVGAAVAAMTVSTNLRARAFTDDATLWAAAARQAPDSLHASWMHALELRRSGQPARALAVLAALAEGADDEGTRHAGRSLWLLEQRRHGEALQEALAFDQFRHDQIFQLDVAISLVKRRAPVEALALLDKLARRSPGSWEVEYWRRQAVDELKGVDGVREAPEPSR